MFRSGSFDIVSLINGHVRLDGGAMFGVVPKTLWAPRVDVDEDNRILLATRTLLAVDRRQGRIMLVDTGCGTKWPPEKAARFAIEYDASVIPNALQALGASSEEVTDVVISHLHFDHNGGLTEWADEPGGPTRLRYPKARHWLHADHWRHAAQPYLKDRASFLAADFAVLGGSDRLVLLEGESPPSDIDGVAWQVSHGHTPYQLHPLFGGPDDAKLLFIGDIVPTSVHLSVPWVMAYDVEPLKTIAERQAIYRRCLAEGVLLAFPHDPHVGAIKLGGDLRKPVIDEPIDLSVS